MPTRFACIVLCAALLACKAYRVPSIPDPPETPPPRLGVARIAPVKSPPDGPLSAEDRGAFTTRLHEDLVATGLFERVLLDAQAAADVVVTATYGERDCLSEPLVTVVTLGIVPYPGCYESGYRLTLAGPALPHGAVTVDNLSSPTALLGWVAGPISLLPGWQASLPRTEEGEALRGAILAAIAAAGQAPPAEAR